MKLTSQSALELVYPSKQLAGLGSLPLSHLTFYTYLQWHSWVKWAEKDGVWSWLQLLSVWPGHPHLCALMHKVRLLFKKVIDWVSQVVQTEPRTVEGKDWNKTKGKEWNAAFWILCQSISQSSIALLPPPLIFTLSFLVWKLIICWIPVYPQWHHLPSLEGDTDRHKVYRSVEKNLGKKCISGGGKRLRWC